MSRITRITLVVIGVVVIIVGAVFAGQGLNLIPGSSMTGDRMWFYVGSILIIVGIVLAVLVLRRTAGAPPRR